MMEIDKQYLDQQFQSYFKLTQEYFEQKLEEKLAAQTRELKDYVQESFAIQQEYIDNRFTELVSKMKFSIDLN